MMLSAAISIADIQSHDLKTNRGLPCLDHLHQPQRTEARQEIVV